MYKLIIIESYNPGAIHLWNPLYEKTIPYNFYVVEDLEKGPSLHKNDYGYKIRTEELFLCTETPKELYTERRCFLWYRGVQITHNGYPQESTTPIISELSWTYKVIETTDESLNLPKINQQSVDKIKSFYKNYSKVNNPHLKEGASINTVKC